LAQQLYECRRNLNNKQIRYAKNDSLLATPDSAVNDILDLSKINGFITPNFARKLQAVLLWWKLPLN
jgi:hypothetical protein